MRICPFDFDDIHRIRPFLEGGSQERNRRAGTESVPLVAGFAKAVEVADARIEVDFQKAMRLKDKLSQRLTNEIDGIIVNGDKQKSIPHILSVSFDSSVAPLDGDLLVMGMDHEGIAVTSGSACSSGSLQPSHVLLAMGRDEQTARATIRFSIGRATTESEIDFAVDALKRVAPRARAAFRKA